MNGPLRDVPAVELAGRVIEESLYHCGIALDRVDQVVFGNVVMPVDAANPARVAALYAGIPDRVPALTVQRNCASGMEAVAMGAQLIASGQARIVVAGGVESMSQTPLLFPRSAMAPMTALRKARGLLQTASAVAALRPRHFKPIAALECGLTDPVSGMVMGKTAERLAQEFAISRADQDAFAIMSHTRAVAAIDTGRFKDEIVPCFAGKTFDPVEADVGPRRGQTLAALAALRPIFDRLDGTVTVGNSCQVTDGAVALVLADAQTASQLDRSPLGFVSDYAVVGLDPSRMGLGPAYAIDRILSHNRLTLDDIALVEINEAFAAQVLACLAAMSSPKFAAEHLGHAAAVGRIGFDRLNVNGGAIALGHPVGASGARLILTLLMEMQQRQVDLGLAALCVGGGQGAALLLQRSWS
jgi:acetyl-CoA C-acetyltransferase/acetyl-CoA acyltransferase